MSIQPLPTPAPSWASPIAVGALATFLVHSLTLAAPDLWVLSCCTCGLSGVPVGFLPAFLVMRRDPHTVPSQCFAVSFISVGIGTLVVAFLVMVVQGWSVPAETLEEFRHLLEQEQMPSEEIEAAVRTFEKIFRFMPLLASGLVIVAGGLTGLITGILMRRRSPPPPA